MTNWVTSDPHLGHANIIKYCGRPFLDVEVMDETIINNWNSLVKDEDIVYCLGDLAYGKGSKEKLKLYLPMLKGSIILIRGNHDRETVSWYKRYGIKEVHGGEYWRYKCTPHVLLSHRPYPVKLPIINIYGHVHNLVNITNPNYRCVSVEQTNYCPIDLDALIEEIHFKIWGS